MEANSWKEIDVTRDFTVFSDYDKFDVLLAAEYLQLCESRKSFVDQAWLDCLATVRRGITDILGGKRIWEIRTELNVRSAFEARDFGKRLVHPHFKV